MDLRPAPDTARLQASARQFEAQSIAALLQPIFATIDPSKGKFGGGAGEAAFRPMLIQQYAEGIARQGGIGIADAVFREMLRAQEGPNQGPSQPAGTGARMAPSLLPDQGRSTEGTAP